MKKSFEKTVVFLVMFFFCCFPAKAYEKAVPKSKEQVSLSFAPVVKKAAPAVVNIYTKKVVTARTRVPLLFNDPFFRGFFGRGMSRNLIQKRIQNSLGSGVIVREEGVIITNHHVINGADEITVVLNDKREFSAEIIGSDEKSDIAVLKVETDGEKLPYLEMRDSDDIEVGDLVLAIGNPFGIGQTVTSGIVSALARTSVGVSDYHFFIQTDASINPGNSGGALITMDGRLLGINTVIVSAGGGSNGIGFATPSNMVNSVLSAMLSGGKASRPWLGAKTQNITSDIAASLGLEKPTGVLVTSVYKGGPADKAGLRKGDIILSVNDKEIDNTSTLEYRTVTHSLDSVMYLSVQRRGNKKELALKLIRPPEIPPRNETDIDGNNPFSGITVSNINPAVAEEMGFDYNETGVVVKGVFARSLIGSFGAKPGDIIYKINSHQVASVDDLVNILQARARMWKIVLKRGSRLISVMVRG